MWHPASRATGLNLAALFHHEIISPLPENSVNPEVMVPQIAITAMACPGSVNPIVSLYLIFVTTRNCDIILVLEEGSYRERDPQSKSETLINSELIGFGNDPELYLYGGMLCYCRLCTVGETLGRKHPLLGELSMNRVTQLLMCSAVMAVMLGLNAQSVQAIPGWNVVIQDELGEVGGQVNDVNEADTLILTGGAVEASETSLVINYVGQGGNGSIGGDNPFPGGFGSTNDFALNATGFVTGLPGEYGVLRAAVNSDDGFRVRVNGNVVGEFVGTRGPGDTFFDVAVANGDFVDLTFFERSGGDEVELFSINTVSGARTLIGANGEIDTAATSVAGPKVQEKRDLLGWNVTIQNASASGFGGVGDVNAGELLLATGGAPEFQGTALLPVFGQNGTSFPAGTDGDNFAMSLNAVLDVLNGDSIQGALYVDSDDGFRLRVNGVVVSEFVGTTGGSDTISNLLILEDGDIIDAVFFEAGGGDRFELSIDFDGDKSTTNDRFALGDFGSGVRALTAAPSVPEPTTAVLGLIGMAGLGLRRRRQNA